MISMVNLSFLYIYIFTYILGGDIYVSKKLICREGKIEDVKRGFLKVEILMIN